MDEIELLRQRIQQLEAERAQMQKELPHIAYQLRVPLTPLKGFIQMLLEDEKEERYTREDRREFYTEIDKNVDRLYELNGTVLRPLGYEPPQ